MGALSRARRVDGKARVVVVDDEDNTRTLLVTSLNSRGFEALGARDGLEALHLFEREGIPHAVVLDLAMPKMNGWQVLDEFWKREDLSKTSIIVVTAHRDAYIPQADAFLVKPVDLERLITTLEEQIASLEN